MGSQLSSIGTPIRLRQTLQIVWMIAISLARQVIIVGHTLQGSFMLFHKKKEPGLQAPRQNACSPSSRGGL